MAAEGSFARNYLIAQLEQVEAALEELDELPEHEADRLGRQQLLRLASELLTALGAAAGSPTPAGPERAQAPRRSHREQT